MNKINRIKDIFVVSIVSGGKMNDVQDDIEKIKLCDSYVKDFELCISKKNSTIEDIRKSFFILVSCEIKHGLYIKKE